MSKTSKTRLFPSLLLCALLLACSVSAIAGDDFKPVPPDELAMKDNPKQPGAHAMILERTDTEDDANGWASHYYRIKIFTDEGKKYADIEIPYVKGAFNVNDIKARTIRPDGTIIPFNGQVYDKLVVKTKDVKFQAKTFTLPDVQPGSIIEYKYKKSWEGLYSTHWELQDELFIKRAVFTIKPAEYPGVGFAWIGVGIPKSNSVQKKGGGYALEINDVPAFTAERYSPPARELKPRIEFFYTLSDLDNQEKFWKRVGQEDYKEIEDFIGHRGGIRDAAAAMVSPSDPAEAKLRKIYDRVQQQVKNLSYSREQTEQEAKRDKKKDVNNSEDVLKRGYGYRYQINRLYAALLRGVGLDAQVLDVSERDEVFFRKDLLDRGQFRGEVVLANADGKQYFLDPGTPMCPFGLLPWKITGVAAYQLSKDGGTFITMPQPVSSNAVTRRTARLRLEDGGLKGTVEVSYRSQEALTWRLNEITSDESQLKTDLENEMKQILPGGTNVTLTGIENARDEYQPLVVHYNVELPFTGSTVGSRIMLPMEVFQSSNRNPFIHENRANPIYFNYPFQEIDDIYIQMPQGFGVENLPQAKKNESAFAYYDANWTQQGNTLVLVRRFAIQGILMPKTIYPDIRKFYEQVNGNDQETVVMRAQNVSSK